MTRRSGPAVLGVGVLVIGTLAPAVRPADAAAGGRSLARLPRRTTTPTARR